jgi:hypothetical protein
LKIRNLTRERLPGDTVGALFARAAALAFEDCLRTSMTLVAQAKPGPLHRPAPASSFSSRLTRVAVRFTETPAVAPAGRGCC